MDNPQVSSNSTLAPGEVEVSGTAGSLKQKIRTGRHHLVADEPVAAGGGDAGPDPYALLLASLGACTSITLRMYAARKQLLLGAVRVRLRHSRIHSKDCDHCETTAGMISRIERDIELEGPLTAEQRTRLLAIANACPVHRTLTSEIDIVSRLVEP
jgi:uncharacterized OsmC-like protein